VTPAVSVADMKQTDALGQQEHQFHGLPNNLSPISMSSWAAPAAGLVLGGLKFK